MRKVIFWDVRFSGSVGRQQHFAEISPPCVFSICKTVYSCRAISISVCVAILNVTLTLFSMDYESQIVTEQ